MSPALGHAKRQLLERIRGSGIEIGAYHSPLEVPRADSVRYVDLLSRDEARRFFPESDNERAVSPDLISPADDLGVLESDSVDFVLASHLLEHVADPLRALEEWIRVVRPGGHLFVALPDPRHGFDRARARTSLAHVIADRAEGEDHPARRERDRAHYREWARWVNGLEDSRQIALWAEVLHQARYPIHFHCWILEDFTALVEHLAATGAPVTIEGSAEVEGCGEFAALLRVHG